MQMTSVEGLAGHQTPPQTLVLILFGIAYGLALTCMPARAATCRACPAPTRAGTQDSWQSICCA